MKKLVLFAFLALSACATARTVTIYPGKGGVVAVAPRDNAEAREKGLALAAQNCPNGYVVEKEGEEVVGATTRTDGHANTTPTENKGTFLGLPITSGGTSASTTATTKQESEWRITYKCK